jgi:hypothetical protein
VIGGHYRDWDEVPVHTVKVELEHLSAWSQLKGITQGHDAAQNTRTITLALPETVQLGEKDAIGIKVVHWVSASHTTDGMQLKEWSQLQLKAESAKEFRCFESLIRSFQKFLTLAVGEPARTTRISADTSDKTAEVNGKPVWREIELIQSSSRAEPTRDVRPEAMLFTLADLRDTQEGLLVRFLDAQTLLQPVFELFFPTYFLRMPAPQELLNLAHAVEAFHRVTVGGQYQTDTEYEGGLKQTLLNAIPPDLDPGFRASIRRKMDFLHHFSLKRRLKDILRQYDPLITPFVGKRDAFIEAVTEARNNLVHGSASCPAIDYAKCWGFAQQLGVVLEVGILATIGFKEDAIKRIIHRGKRANLIMNNVGNGITIY